MDVRIRASSMVALAGAGALLLAATKSRADAPPPAPPAPVATPAPTTTPAPHWRSEVKAGGIILIGLGAFLALPAAWLATNEFGAARTQGTPATRFAMLGVVGGLVVSGVTLAIVGATGPRPAPKSAQLLPSVRVGASSATLLWRF
jgi:hypothetical protein